MRTTHDVTRLLAQWAQGDEKALADLTPLVYRELRQLAAGYLRKERDGHTLQPTALVHEAYLRLVEQARPDWENRSHFFGVASRLMRQILVDHARKNKSAKRGSGVAKASLEDALNFAPERSPDILSLDDALQALAKVDERKCKIIELRFFGGFSIDETAQAMGISSATVGREQRLAEAWLHRELSHGATA